MDWFFDKRNTILLPYIDFTEIFSGIFSLKSPIRPRSLQLAILFLN